LAVTGQTNLVAVNAPTGATTIGAGTIGFLDQNTVLTSFKGGAGADFLDISSQTSGSQMAAYTSLDGGGGRDTLLLHPALFNTTTALHNTNFEILGASANLSGKVDFSKLGTGADTISLFGQAGGDTNIINGAGTMTLALNGFAGAKDFSVTAAGSGAADVLNIGATNQTGTGTIGALTATGYETVTATFSGNAADSVKAITATPTAGALLVFNLTDNQTGGALTVSGDTNVGTGTLKIAGTSTGNIVLAGDVTSGTLDASGLGTAAAATVAGVTMAGKVLAAINIIGSAGADAFTGSAAADTINGGTGNDILANMANGVGGVGAADVLTGGACNDQFILRGDFASAALPGLYASATSITDMTVNAGTTATDFITVSATTANYKITNASGHALKAAATVQGEWTVQSVDNATAVAMTSNANELIKLTTGVSSTGLTLQTLFNAAIGTSQVTSSVADKSYFFTMYDITNSKMVLGIVQDQNGTNTKVESGDIVSLVGTASMSATDYANLNASHFSVVAA
jgi:hypothetical protein